MGWGGGRNFERPNVERPIFRNLKIADVKSYEVQLFDFFIYEIICSFFFKLFEHSIFFYPNFNALIFYNSPNLIFFEILKLFLINKFCEFLNLLHVTIL